MSLSARRRALVIAGSSVLAGFTLMAPAYAATSGHSTAPAVTTVTAGPHTPDGAAVQPGGVSHLVGPARTHPGARNATTTSTNWSGYAATGNNGAFSSISASWVEPTGICRSGQQYSSFWVGLDGYNSNSVEQTGSEVDCSGSTPQYYSWYEMYPAYPVNFSNAVRPGDHFTGSVTFTGGSSFTLKLSDTTRGWSHTVTKNPVRCRPVLGGGYRRGTVLHRERGHPAAGRLRQGQLLRLDGQRGDAEHVQPGRDQHGLG